MRFNKLLIQFVAQLEIEKWTAEKTKAADDYVEIDLILFGWGTGCYNKD